MNRKLTKTTNATINVLWLVVFLLSGVQNEVSAQAYPARSQATIESNNSLDYRVWRVFSEDLKGFTIIVVSVNPRHFNPKDMTALAARLKQEFSGKAKLKVGLLDDPVTARLFVEGRVNYPTYESAERGRYYLDRTSCREYIQFSARREKPKRTIRIKCAGL